MKYLFLFIFVLLSINCAYSQEVKVDASDNKNISLLLNYAGTKMDSLKHFETYIKYAEERREKLKIDITMAFKNAQIEMLKILGRYGYNPDTYTLNIKRNENGDIELYIVKKIPAETDPSPEK